MIYNRWTVLLALILLVAAGAARGQAQAPPEVPPPEGPPAAEGQSVPEDPPGVDLATLYDRGGLTADDAAARALERAPSVARARAAAMIAQAAADRAFVGVLPRLELSARYTRLSDVRNPNLAGDFDREFIDAAVADVDDSSARLLFRGIFAGLDSFEFPVILNQYGLRATVSYPVSDLFFTILPAYRATSAIADAQRLQVEAERQTVELQAREAFYSYARARGALLVAEATVVQIESQRRNVQALVEAGVAAPVDLMRMNAQLAAARVGVERARAGVVIAAQALRTLMDVEGDDPLIPIGEDLQQPPPPLEERQDVFMARAREQRAEVRALRLLATGREGLVTAARGERYPRLGLQANYDYANPNNRIIPQQQEWRGTWDVNVILSWSPSDFLTGNASVSRAEAELQQVRADLAALDDMLELEVTQSYSNYEAARAALEAAQVGIEAAEETYRVRLEQMRAGTAVTADLIDAETELTRARLDLLDALIGAQIAQARLVRAVGD